MSLKYVSGDATEPILEGAENHYILHVCNDIGAWGAGFVVALSKKWSKPEEVYREFAEEQEGGLQLGDVQFCTTDVEDLYVVNMVAQRHIRPQLLGQKQTQDGELISPIRYPALTDCLKSVVEHVKRIKMPNVRFHFPLFGAGLAGGDWDTIEAIVLGTIAQEFECYAYVFPKDEEFQYLLTK